MHVLAVLELVHRGVAVRLAPHGGLVGGRALVGVDDAAARGGLGLESRGVGVVGGGVSHVAVEVGVAGGEPGGVLGQESPGGGVVVAGPVVIQSGLGVEFAGGEPEAVAIGGDGLGDGVSEGVVVDAVQDRGGGGADPRQGADRTESVGQIPVDGAGAVEACQDLIDGRSVEVAAGDGARGVEVGEDLDAVVGGEGADRGGGSCAVGVEGLGDPAVEGVVGVGGGLGDGSGGGVAVGDRDESVTVVVGELADLGGGFGLAADQVALVVVGVSGSRGPRPGGCRRS